ncbi:MAG: AraC family transcriptional regulator [Lachnospira sp.]
MQKNSHFVINRTIHPLNHRMPTPHYHPYYELLYIINGNCNILINNNMYSIRSGTIALIPSNILHKTSYYGDIRPERIYVEFTKDYVTDILNLSDNILFSVGGKLIFLPFSVRDEINLDFNQILDEYNSDYYLKEYMLKSMFEELIIKLLRYFKEFKIYELTDLVEPPDLTMQMVMDYISNHYLEHITLDDLASISHLNPAYLSKKFKDVNGIGFKEYINTLRIHHAEELLMNSDMSIVEVALSCGYDNSNYFGDIFKKLKGISPSQFRKSR